MLLTTPEYRLSMMLKRQELWQQDNLELWSALGGIVEQPYYDLLDESDELLHHKLQLIYACGDTMALPALQSRARAGQTLLMLLSKHAALEGSPIGAVLRRPGVSVLDQGPDRPPGAFCGVRLLPGDALAAAAADLNQELALGVMRAPPYSLRWIEQYVAACPNHQACPAAPQILCVLLGPPIFCHRPEVPPACHAPVRTSCCPSSPTPRWMLGMLWRGCMA